MRHLFLAVFLVVACATGTAAGPIEEAKSAYDRGDYVLAERLYHSLAEQGDRQAQSRLGWIYAEGKGVPQNGQEAAKWYRKAAEQGYVWAQFSLGMMYDKGQGVPQDYQEALKWYRKAADQGHAEAHSNLGRLYEFGHGVTQNYVQADMWYILGAAHGDKLGAELHDALAKRMTRAQIFQAQQRALEWKPIKK